MPMPQTFPADVDFESLPPALRRKYFSSLERLRLAQDGSSTSSHLYYRHSLRSNHNAGTRSKFLSKDLDYCLRNAAGSLCDRLQKRHPLASRTLVTPDLVAWYHSLPPVIQRKHFSRQEQDFFVSQRRQRIGTILDAADEVIQRRHRSENWLKWCTIRHTRSDQRGQDKFQFEPESCISPLNMTTDYFMDSFRWLEDDEELDLRLNTYHTDTIEIEPPHRHHIPRRTFSRNISLSSLSLRRSSTSSPPSAALNGSVHLNKAFGSLPRPPSQTSFKHWARTSVTSLEPNAAHYQDPAARAKLRVYLASPSKFDEALEFGFPSVQEREQMEQRRPKTSGARHMDEPHRTFFSDRTPSLSGDDGEDRDDSFSDPRTPTETSFYQTRGSVRVSPDRPVIRPFYSRGGLVNGYAHGNASDREMTLHMTLTRPDLRSPEELHKPIVHVNNIPIEQPDLNTDSMPSIWDTLPPAESKTKRFLKKLKLR